MSIEDFGEVQSLISLLAQLSVFVGIFSIITTNITANYDNDRDRDAVISTLRKIAFYISGVLFLAIIIFSSSLKEFFRFSSVYPFISLAFLLLTGVSFVFRRSFLQGINDFKAVSWSGVIFSSGKLGFAVLLVYFGWRSLGAISGLIIAQMLTLVYVYHKTKTSLNLSRISANNMISVIKAEYKYALLIFLTTSAITFLYTADVLMVKHWFSPSQAGLYSGIATIARIIFFATGSISAVLFSAVKIKNGPELNKKILKKALGLILFIVGGAWLVFFLFSELIIEILIGSRYLVLAHLLAELSLLMAMVSLINLLFFYFLALRRPIIFSAALVGPAIVCFLIFFRHDSLEQIIYDFLIGSAAVLAVLFYGIFKKR